MKNIFLVFIFAVSINVSANAKEKSKDVVNTKAGASEIAVFAGGCFWCMEPPFDNLPGVSETKSGYSGGDMPNPTYEDISKKVTGHREVIRITFDPKKITYAELLDVFWKNIDPYDRDGQFCDKGDQYKSAIYYQNDSQKKLAEDSIKKVTERNKIKQMVVTEILPGKTFYDAEEYHQDYYLKNPIRYKYYRNSCGRDRRLKELSGK